MLAAGARPLRLTARERARRRLHEDLLQLHQPAYLRHGGGRRHARIQSAAAGRRAGIAGQAPLSVLARGRDRLPAGLEGLQVPRAVPGRRPRRPIFMAGEVLDHAGWLGMDAGGFHRLEFIRLPFLAGRAAPTSWGASSTRRLTLPDRGGVRETPGTASAWTRCCSRNRRSPTSSAIRAPTTSPTPTSGGGCGAIPCTPFLPRKPIDELYTCWAGCVRARTERFRTFSDHLGRKPRPLRARRGRPRPGDGTCSRSVVQPGVQVIRDLFGYPKNTTREQVISKYRLVSRHDHAGRPDRHPGVPEPQAPGGSLRAGAPRGAAEGAAETVQREGSDLVLNRVYIERRVRPLNPLHPRGGAGQRRRRGSWDYGQAIKDLAETNIFPGDLLLKKLRVTASGRVVFYDYDEVALVDGVPLPRAARARRRLRPDGPGGHHTTSGRTTSSPRSSSSSSPWRRICRKAFLAATRRPADRAVLAGREEPPAGGGDLARDSVPTAGVRECGPEPPRGRLSPASDRIPGGGTSGIFARTPRSPFCSLPGPLLEVRGRAQSGKLLRRRARNELIDGNALSVRQSSQLVVKRVGESRD